MFQNFESCSNPNTVHKRLTDLRVVMAQAHIDVFLVPHNDEYQNEYMPPRAERLAWLTAFTGSAGFAIIFLDRAILFVDDRYRLQAAQQTDLSCFTLKNLVGGPRPSWLADNFSKAFTVGFDSHLFTINQQRLLQSCVEKNGGTLKPTKNLIDQIWLDQPEEPQGLITIFPENCAGKAASKKISALIEVIKNESADFCLLTSPASINWLFNIRGCDVGRAPLALSRCIVRQDGKPFLFIDEQKLDSSAKAYLDRLAECQPSAALESRLKSLVKNATLMVDPDHVSIFFAKTILTHGGKLIYKRDPLLLPRAIKNEQEIEGSRNAHLRDGVAMAGFLYWLDQQPFGSVDEICAVKYLECIRKQTALNMHSALKDIAFDTISGAGANGAICHYRVTNETNATLRKNSLYLIDSGGQYMDGTTDITRTIAIGPPPKEAIEDFTLVLKGHIALAISRFPEDTRGVDLDSLARIALWKRGRNYAHGTGHGVGAYLCVHEGPQAISRAGMEILRPGMILSNEPGYYREGHYGIRIENLVLVREPEIVHDGNLPMLGFETLTLAPIDRRLIDPVLMSDEELQWLNSYHAWVNRKLSPYLKEPERHWLSDSCAPLSV